MLAKEPLEVGDRAALGTPDPGALCHPSTLRRRSPTRSIRRRDLSRVPAAYCAHEDARRSSSARRRAAAARVPRAAAACSPLNCAPSQFSSPTARCSASAAPRTSRVRVVDLRTGPDELEAARRDRRRRHARPPGRASTSTWYDAPAARSSTPWRCRARRSASPASRRTARARSASCGDAATARRSSRARAARQRDHARRQALGLRRAARRQALPDQVPAARRLPGAARTTSATGGSSRAAQGPARVGDDLGLSRSRGSPRPTGATCSRCTSARTAARWCTSST